MEKRQSSQKNIYFLFLLTSKASLDVGSQLNRGKFPERDVVIAQFLICLLRKSKAQVEAMLELTWNRLAPNSRVSTLG